MATNDKDLMLKFREHKRRCENDFPYFARTDLLVDAKGGGRPVPFVLNEAQTYVYSRFKAQQDRLGFIRMNILKGRQQGMSTMVAAYFFHQCVTRYGVRALIVSKDAKATRSVFAKIKRYAVERPISKDIEVGACNMDEISFPRTDSSIICQTARADNVARGSTFSLVHLSECPYWEHAEEQVAAIMDAVPRAKGTAIILESTARGRDSLFYPNYKLGESGKSDWESCFVPWFWQSEYRIDITPDEDWQILPSEQEVMDEYNLTPEQIKWRRYKLFDYKRADPLMEFKREYPCIASGSRVGTDKGILPIEEVKPGMMTSSGLVLNNIYKQDRECVELTTYRGYTLRCTPDHRIYAKKNDVWDWYEACDLLGSKIKLCTPTVNTLEVKLSYNHLKSLEVSTFLDEDFAQFLGLFMGDGSLHCSTLSLAYNYLDEDCAHWWADFLRERFGLECYFRKTSKNGREARVSSVAFKNFMVKIGCADDLKNGNTKRKVCVPECIMRGTREHIASFLRGVFTADGFACTYNRQIKLFAHSLQFLRDIQYLLLAFGIKSRASQHNKKGSHGHFYIGYELVINSYFSMIYHREIGFCCDRKRKVSEYYLGDSFVEPTVGCKKETELEDEVISINPIGKLPVYDLEIEGNHCFDADGILVHNCCPSDAFEASSRSQFFDMERVKSAMDNQPLDCRFDNLYVGVDIGSSGDPSVACFRRGANVERFVEFKSDSLDLTEKWISDMVRSYRPYHVCIDNGPISMQLCQHLKQAFPSVVQPISFGGSPDDGVTYSKKRAEMCDRVRMFFANNTCYCVSNTDLIADMQVTSAIPDKAKLTMVDKETLRKSLGRSTDNLDALMLTFATDISMCSRGGRSSAPSISYMPQPELRMFDGDHGIYSDYPNFRY